MARLNLIPCCKDTATQCVNGLFVCVSVCYDFVAAAVNQAILGASFHSE